MQALPSGFEACGEPETGHGEAAALPHLQSLVDSRMRKRMLWVVCALDHGALDSTAAVFDALWGKPDERGQWPQATLGKAGRHLSVRRTGDKYWALVHKGDQAVLELGSLSVRATTVFEIPKPGLGKAGARAILDFAREWFASAEEHTSNFRVLDAPTLDVVAERFVKQAFEETKGLSKEEFLEKWALAKAKTDKGFTNMAHQLGELRRIAERRTQEEVKKNNNPVYCKVQPDDPRMPNDFINPEGWDGETWSPDTRQKEHMDFMHWLNTKEHLEPGRWHRQDGRGLRSGSDAGYALPGRPLLSSFKQHLWT